ncbi:MAG: leucine-rich repeat protein [Pseudoruminococcus massiliensis]|uniref:leucine-rich repeat protein n=1 Tax=Pseudoruminococcus massiliensis TaxID=2086583 RepID=UPI003993A21A
MMKYYSKRFISILLMICMLLAGFPTQAFAMESANYTLNYTANGDSTVSITGISVAEGFEEADLAVEIPETIDGMTVTKIEGTRWSAFAGYHVTSVSIPASVTEIGAGAFMNCQYLTQVTFAEGSAPSFEDAYNSNLNGVFAGCTALTSIELPAGTTKLGTYMFSGCESLTSVNLSELTQITEIPFRAFERCALSSVELPENISRVAQDAFSANYICTGLDDYGDEIRTYTIQDIVLNEGLIEIGSNAFGGAVITSLILPNSLTTIGQEAFSGCYQLAEITWPDNKGFTEINGFDNCTSLPDSIFESLPVTVTSIGYQAFSGCRFSSVSLPGTIETIGERAFAYNYNLKTLTLHEGLQSIGVCAFYSCNGTDNGEYMEGLLNATIVVPETVTYIGAGAFSVPYNSYYADDANPGLTLKILNRDLTLKDENEYNGFIPILSGVAYATICGYRYKSDGVTESDLYAYAQSCKYTWEELSETQPVYAYTVSGKVTPADASIVVEKGGERIAHTSDESGAFSFTVKNDEDVKVVFSADGYIDQSLVRAAGSTGNWDLGNVELATLPVSRTITVSLSDSEGKNLYSFDGLTLVLKAGEKTLTEDTDYTLQFPYIILKDTVSVEKNTTLTLTAETDESLKRSGATATTTLARPRLELVLPAWGNVVIPTVSSFTGGHNILIFDSEGNLSEYGTVSSTIMEETYSYTSDKLKAGSYTAVIFNQNQYLSVIPALSGLTSCGMTEDVDYKKISFTVRDGETTAIDTVAVPVLNTKKFSTIVNTDFSCVRLDENSPLTGVKFRARVFYGFADNAVASGTLTINIPADATVSYIGNEIGRLDAGAASNGYTKSGNTLTIPVSRNKGVVFMDLSVTGTGNRVISAALSDGEKTSPLGSCAFNCYTTRLTLPSEYFESRIATITATIKAKPQTNVDVYLDGEKKGTVTTDKLGIAYFDFTPPADAAIGQKLTVSTQTAEGDGGSAVIKNYPTDAVVKEFYFTQYHSKYYVVQDSRLTKNLSYSYVFTDSKRDECKDWSFSATVNGKSPLDEELTSVTITMKTGDIMEVPLYLSGKTVCDDGSTDYVFTGMVTLEHPGVIPNYFDNERVPVRLDLNYASILDDSMKAQWAAQGKNGTQTLMAELTASTALTEQEEKEIDDKYENPWTDEFLNEYSASLVEDFCQYYYYYEYCVDPANPTDAEKAKAEAAAKADVDKMLEPFTTTDQGEINSMINMLFGDEWVIEFDEEVLSYATEEERQEVYEFQSEMLSLQNSIDNLCGYISAGLLLDKNLTDYADGIEIAEEMGISLSPELAAKAKDGTLDDYMKTVSVKVEQEENSNTAYVYDQSGALLYTMDTAKLWDKVIANKDIINSGKVENALPGGNGAAALSINSYSNKAVLPAILSAQEGEEEQGSLALAHDALEAAVSYGGDFWLGLGGTAAGEVADSMAKELDFLVNHAPRILQQYSQWNMDYWLGKMPYISPEYYREISDSMTKLQLKAAAFPKIAPALEKTSKVIGKAGDLANAVQFGNDVIDIYSINNEIENWEDEVARHRKLYFHYLQLEVKDCESFPTKFQCADAHEKCMDEGRTLQRLYKQLRQYASLDAGVAGLSLACSFVPGVGTVAGLTVAGGGYLYGKAADDAKAQLQADITTHELEFQKGERAAKKYCKIDRNDCPDEDSSSDGSGPKSSGNSSLGSGSIGSDLRECLDPSGIVYEAVESNPLSGVTAELWYSASKDGTNAVKWDAENYGGQINPQLTDAEGMYSWYVPDGYWKVKFTKDGYIAAETEWMEVPPPQLDVNIGLISTAAPAVQSINAYPDYVEIIFTQYMSVTKTLTIPDGYTYEWAEKTPVNTESNICYSKVLRLIPNNKAKVGDTVSVSIEGAENYAGTSLSKYISGSLTVVPRPAKIVLNYEDQISVHMGENPTPRVTVRVLDSDGNPISGLKILAVASSDFYASVSPVNDITGEDGIATFAVEGLLPGTTKLTLSVENTSLRVSIPLLVTHKENRPERPTAKIGEISLTAASPKENFVTVRSGETMTLSCGTDGAVIYYTTDGTCPCQNTASRMRYTDPITITENTKFRIAAYKDGMDYSERLNITVTVDDTHQHSYGSEWKSDENGHWHECDCGAVSDRAEHDWKVENAKEATATEPGYAGDKTCKVCGYEVKGEKIPATGTTKPTEPTNPGDDNPTNPVNPDSDKPTNPKGDGNENTNSPQTGDNSNLWMWFAVLFISGGMLVGTTVYSKKKKYSK